MVITCPSCSARYRLPASLKGGGHVTCPRCANRFTAVPPSRVKRPPPAVSTPVVAISEGGAADDHTLPPGAMAMIQLWEDAQDSEEETAEPDKAELDAARKEVAEEASSKGVFLRRDLPEPAPTPPPVAARPRGPASRSPAPAERSGATRQRPEHDPKALAEQLVMDSMISSRASVVAPRAAGPGLGTWVLVAVLVALCGGAGAVVANQLTQPTVATSPIPVTSSVPAPPVALPPPVVEPVAVVETLAPPEPSIAPPTPARIVETPRSPPAPRPSPSPRPAPVLERSVPAPAAPAPRQAEPPAPEPQPPATTPEPALEVRTSDLKNPFDR